MAADLKPHDKEIVQQFTDLFFGQYMTEQWGIEVGYKSIPPYLATMRMELLGWQQGMDCTNSLCQQSISAVTKTIDCPCCPSGYFLLANEDRFVCSLVPGITDGRTDVDPIVCTVDTTSCCSGDFTFVQSTFYIFTSTGVQTFTGNNCIQFNQPDVIPLVVTPGACGASSVTSLASGTRVINHDNPCCNDNARFQPL